MKAVDDVVVPPPSSASLVNLHVWPLVIVAAVVTVPPAEVRLDGVDFNDVIVGPGEVRSNWVRVSVRVCDPLALSALTLNVYLFVVVVLVFAGIVTVRLNEPLVQLTATIELPRSGVVANVHVEAPDTAALTVRLPPDALSDDGVVVNEVMVGGPASAAGAMTPSPDECGHDETGDNPRSVHASTAPHPMGGRPSGRHLDGV